MLIKARTITILKGNTLIMILVREDKEVFLNFGSEDWIDFKKIFEMKKKIKHQKYQEWIENPRQKKNFKETMEVIEKSKDYMEICEHFHKDFRKDRSARIAINDLEMETDKEKIAEIMKKRQEAKR